MNTINWWKDRAFGIIAGLVTLVIIWILMIASAQDTQRKKTYIEKHNCVLVEYKESSTSWGWVAGEWAMMTSPEEKVYECDGGIKYKI